MRDDPEAEGSVHAPVALGPLELLRAPKLLDLLRCAFAEQFGREREYGYGLHPKVVELASGDNFAALTTLLPDRHPQTQLMWIDADGTHLLLNTEVHRQKFKNVQRDPRVTITIWDKEDPYSFVEVRGEVVEKTKEPKAKEHIDHLSYKYHGRPYGTPIRSERVVLRIAASRQVIRVPP